MTVPSRKSQSSEQRLSDLFPIPQAGQLPGFQVRQKLPNSFFRLFEIYCTDGSPPSLRHRPHSHNGISLRYRLSPFLTLIGGALLFGLLSGMTPDETFNGIITGVGKVFSAFGIIILCGAVIAKLLQEQHQTEEIVCDIARFIKNPPVISGFSGTCSLYR